MQYIRLKELRDSKAKSQITLAKELGLYTTTYARYERGEQELPLHMAIKLADFYGVSIDYIAGRTDNPERAK